MHFFCYRWMENSRLMKMYVTWTGLMWPQRLFLTFERPLQMTSYIYQITHIHHNNYSSSTLLRYVNIYLWSHISIENVLIVYLLSGLEQSTNYNDQFHHFHFHDNHPLSAHVVVTFILPFQITFILSAIPQMLRGLVLCYITKERESFPSTCI